MQGIEKYLYDAVAVCKSEIGDKYSCYERHLGFFEVPSDVKESVKKTEDVVFAYIKVWILNPEIFEHGTKYFYMYTLDKDGNFIYIEPTHHFFHGNTPNGHVFVGRNEHFAEKGEDAWFYEPSWNAFFKCKIGDVPPSKEFALKRYGLLDWRDDSYLVYPYRDMEEGKDNHRHIQTCFIFSDEYIEKNLS